MSLSLGLLLVPLAQSAQDAARPEPAREASPFLYYDYVEDGQLRGGRVPIDRTNPLHVSIGPERRGTGSFVATLLDNGPPENRIDLVLVGDGYTAAQLGQYANDVDAVWPAFLAEPPLSQYATYFNIHRVDVISAESGVDNDPNQGIQRQTALDMGYWCGGTQRLLCVNVAKANSEASNAPDRDTVLALANSSTYGGAGYTDLGTLAGRNGSAIEIALHEFGHSFADLADEYDYGGPTTYSGPEPSQANVSLLDEAGLIAQQKKWVLWLDLPHFGAFQGGMYSSFGIYRPTVNSKMRNLGRPFQEFNSERILRNIYRIVRPIDAATPAGIYPYQASFFVDPVDPVGHQLDVQWSLDGSPIPGATATAFDAATLGLSSGSHTLSVEVVDNTPLVRSPGVRAAWMTEERTWTLGERTKLAPHAAPTGLAGPVLALQPGSGPHGKLAFELRGPPDAPESGPALALLWIATSAAEAERGPAAALMARSFGSPRAAGRPLTLEVPLPGAAALSVRPLHARAAWIPLDGRAPVRSNPVEFTLDW